MTDAKLVTTARHADVATIDGIVKAMYECISGPAGAPRDWDRQRTLYLDHARLVPVRRSDDGEMVADSFDVEGYRISRTPFFERTDFYEVEIARRLERFGSVVHVFSTYEGRPTADGAAFVRGINSIQLVWQRDRWWVVSIMWQNESAEARIPEEYLTSASVKAAKG